MPTSSKEWHTSVTCGERVTQLTVDPCTARRGIFHLLAAGLEVCLLAEHGGVILHALLELQADLGRRFVALGVSHLVDV